MAGRLGLVVLLLVLFLGVTYLPPGSATSPLGPYDVSAEVSGDARVGREMVIIATFRNHWAGDEPRLFRLEVPQWVEVASSRNWPLESTNGTTHRRAWVLTPTQQGLWSAEISARDPETSELRGSAWSGLTAWSARDAGRWGKANELERVLPDGGGTGRLTAREVAPDVYNVTYEAIATAPWLKDQNITITLARWAASTAVPVDPQRPPVPVAWGERGVLYERLEIEDGGERASTAARLQASVLFPGAVTGPREERVTIDCRTITVLPDWKANLPPQGERECRQGTAWHSPGPDAVLVVAAFALIIGLTRRARNRSAYRFSFSHLR